MAPWRCSEALAAFALLQVCSARRLSRADHELRQGAVESSPPLPKARHFVFVHTPKAAGASFMKAVPTFMVKGNTLIGNEESAAFSDVTQTRLSRREGSGRAIMLRRPVQLACVFSVRPSPQS